MCIYSAKFCVVAQMGPNWVLARASCTIGHKHEVAPITKFGT